MIARLAAIVTLSLLSSLALAGPKASSELRDSEGQRHTAQMAFDGLLSTGWAEGEDGHGEGSWLELALDRPTDVKSVSIWPGNLSKGRRSLAEYGRPRTVTVTLFLTDGSQVTHEERFTDGRLERAGPQRIDIAIEGKARRMRVTIDDVYEGGVFNHTFIAEIAVNFAGGEMHPAVARARSYQESGPGLKAKEQNHEEVIALFTQIQEAEFGDRDALQELIDRAGDGAPYLRRQAARVPFGFRVQALPPDESALQALQKLQDANAIPAFEMAALRSVGKQQRLLELQTEYFYALSQLIGGGDRNIPVWGQPGWEPGALQAFGEPMNLEVDRWGDVYVADLGNHRVVRFNPEGRHQKIWGGEAGITNVWFSQTRPYYVGGAMPGDKPGTFSNPVDLDLIPGKEGEGFVTLDATGRVQLFDEDGRPVRSWSVRTRRELRPNVGGEGYVLHARGKIVVVWRNEVFVYGQDGEELSNFKLEEGSANGAEALKNGKLLLIFSDKLVQYSTDGFRHGTVIQATDIGPGIEDWAVTFDERNKLWAVTDTGWLVKYKRPGKVDFKVRFSDVDLIRPRVAVFDGIAYITDRGRILKIDALALKEKQEREAEGRGS
ncbi:MAG: hypothetical protein EA397_03635 [Deltaproteobacteria bacterium]|nr:MAG: hypothetical protein EA397_03635 [Deltaproteobacteria bacterium]